jgi:anti-sigma factor (TIGR02949 family)
MSACGEYASLLHGLFDGELDAEHASRVEAHMASCPACAEEYDKLAALRASIRGANVRRLAPDALRRRVRSSIAPSRLLPQRAAWPIVMALAACLVIAVLPRQPDIAQDVASNHAHAVTANHLMDVESPDHATVKPWLEARLDFSPPLYDLAAQGYPLAGGRVEDVEGRKVAAVVYRHDNHFINLYIWPEGQHETPAEALTRNGLNVLHWTKHGMTCWAVSDLNSAEMRRFESLVLSSNPV